MKKLFFALGVSTLLLIPTTLFAQTETLPPPTATATVNNDQAAGTNQLPPMMKRNLQGKQGTNAQGYGSNMMGQWDNDGRHVFGLIAGALGIIFFLLLTVLLIQAILLMGKKLHEKK